MASKIKVDQIEGSTGSTITVPTGQTLTITDGLAASTIGSGTLAEARLPTVSVAKGGTNLTSFAAGDVLYATGATTLAKLPKGAASNVLTMNSGATAPEWAAAAGGGAWTFISKTTISDDATVDIESGIDSTYPLYAFSANDMRCATDDAYFEVRVKTSSFQTGGDYHYHVTDSRANGTSLDNASNNANSGNHYRLQTNNGQGNAALESFNYLLYLPNPSGTVFHKVMWGEGGGMRSDGAMCRHMSVGGFAGNGDAITGIRFFMNTGNITSGTITMYGIKDS